jgi:hypothetical protein
MTSHHELRIRNDFECIWTRLINAISVMKYGCSSLRANIYQVDNLTEMDLDAAFVEIRIPRRIVDKLGQFALAHFGRAIAKDEQKGVDSI